MRNRYVGRTFIEGTADRAAKARLKYTPLPEVLAGKRVLLVEDSIVRSTTMRALVHEIRDRGGAREIHLRVACPPIIAPCFYGIDMSRRDELFATRFADLPDGGVSAAAQQTDGQGARGRQPPLPARRGDRTLGQPLARPALPRLHHRAVTPPRPASSSTRPTRGNPATPTARAGSGRTSWPPRSRRRRPDECCPADRSRSHRCRGTMTGTGVRAARAGSPCGRWGGLRAGTCVRSWSGNRGRARATSAPGAAVPGNEGARTSRPG